MLVGVAVFCGLVLLFNAQALLNRYAELYMMDTEGSSTAVTSRANATHHGPVLASTTAEPVHAGGSAAPEPAASHNPVVTETERAAAIYVSGAERIAEVAASDRWVDVILTHQPGTSASFSEVVLENVKVLTIELTTADGGIGERSTSHAVTLDVDSDTAENLVLASRSGKLSLALHRPGDHGRAPSVHSGGAEGATPLPGSVPDARLPSGPELAASSTSTAAPDDDGFTIVTVHRVGGISTTHRVPRER